MSKSGVIIGGVIGAIAVIAVFAFILIPTSLQPEIPSNDLIISNGHSVSTVGETTSIYERKNLSLIQIFEKSESGVVRVNVQRPEQIVGVSSVGSGFVFDSKGHIITNAHVVDNARKIVVTYLDGRSYNAEIVGLDLFTDVAVIKAKVDKSLLQPLLIGDSSTLRVGEQIAAIGNPFGLSGSMTAGIVSQLGRLLPTQNSGFSIPDVI